MWVEGPYETPCHSEGSEMLPRGFTEHVHPHTLCLKKSVISFLEGSLLMLQICMQEGLPEL